MATWSDKSTTEESFENLSSEGANPTMVAEDKNSASSIFTSKTHLAGSTDNFEDKSS